MNQGTEAAGTADEAERKRAAVEMIARHEGLLRRTALRYSLDAEDAEDACQRALEIVLTKAPTTDPRELVRWTRTVVKHEALAMRASRERLLSRRRGSGEEVHDPIAAIPSREDPPDEQVERREEIAHSREALQALKPGELRALGLLAEGYSYAEIGELTGFSRTKVNRLLAEGRARFRAVAAAGDDGRRCRELRPLLSAFCDGEASPREAATVREHLRACAGCRSTMRAYRTAPRLAAALLPLLPESRSLLDRIHGFAGGVAARLPGLGGEAAATQVAAAVAACVAVGVLPAPTQTSEPPEAPLTERAATSVVPMSEAPAPSRRSAPQLRARAEDKAPKPAADPAPEAPPSAPIAPVGTSAAPVEYEAPPLPAEEPPSPVEASGATGSAAGEFGP